MPRREFLRLASLAAVSGCALLEPARAQSEAPVVAETPFGKIRGIENRGIKVFKGVPYGADTAGSRRFLPPVDPEPWTGVRDALAYGHSAPQSVHRPAPPRAAGPTPAARQPEGPSIFRALAVPGAKDPGEGEDCLVLNLWTPALDDGGKRPVMVWLHGGGFRGGSGSNPGWDGTNLCQKGNVVVLTINHRLNVCGFAEFSGFDPDFAGSGQAGMLDIVHALKWVRTNIARFGGDPDRVMIFGQSGGGRKCETLLAMPSAKGLFHRAAIESGIAIRIVEREQAARNAEALVAKLGVPKTDVRRVQQLPLEQILTAAAAVDHELGRADLDTMGFAPCVDGAIIPQHPFHPSASPVSADVPVLIGCTRTEWTGMTTDAALWRLDEPGMRAHVQEMLGDGSAAMIDLYRRASPDASPSDLFFLIASDYHYGMPLLKIAERRAALGRGPVFLYYFAWASPVQEGRLQSPHNIEWPFAFDNVKLCANLTGGGPEAVALGERASDAWIAFAHTGDPNTPSLPRWPRLDAGHWGTLVIDNDSRAVEDPLKGKRVAMFRALDLS